MHYAQDISKQVLMSTFLAGRGKLIEPSLRLPLSLKISTMCVLLKSTSSITKSGSPINTSWIIMTTDYYIENKSKQDKHELWKFTMN